jgi:hypothetical protein
VILHMGQFWSQLSSCEYRSIPIPGTVMYCSRNWLPRRSMMCFGMKIPYLNKWRHHHDSRIEIISYRHPSSWKPRSRNHSHDIDHLICHYPTPLANQTCFQYYRWCSIAMPSHAIRTFWTVLSRNQLCLQNRLACILCPL